MKALIAIDIEDKAFEYYSKQNPKALTVDLMDHVGKRRGFYRPKFLSLKPMPERKKVIPIFTHNRENAKLEIANQNKGFNDCIDELLGEAE